MNEKIINEIRGDSERERESDRRKKNRHISIIFRKKRKRNL